MQPSTRPNYVLKHTIADHDRALSSVKFSPNGDLLASASCSRLRRLKSCLATESAFANRIAAADLTVRLYSWDGVFKASLNGHTQGISDVAWTQDSRYVATASDDKLLKVWDVETGQCLHSYAGHSHHVFCCNFDMRGSAMLVSGSYDEHVKVWDVRHAKEVRTLASHSDPVTAADFNLDGSCIVSASHDGLIRIWDTTTGNCLKTIFAEGNPAVCFATYTPNSEFILAGTLDHRIRLWTVGTTGTPTKCMKTYKGHHNDKYSIFSAFCLTQGQHIVSGSEDKKVYLWNINSRQVVQTLEAHADAVLAVSTHPTRDIMASGSLDKTVKLWEHRSVDVDEDAAEQQQEDKGKGDGNAKPSASAKLKAKGDRKGRGKGKGDRGKEGGRQGTVDTEGGNSMEVDTGEGDEGEKGGEGEGAQQGQDATPLDEDADEPPSKHQKTETQGHSGVDTSVQESAETAAAAAQVEEAAPRAAQEAQPAADVLPDAEPGAAEDSGKGGASTSGDGSAQADTQPASPMDTD
ncbi:WD40-repeat-containing domain protein [Tribonema minus]|uniref:WD40-repeat-containing domain protein n=1 Tax=Tribonema minus TaxID=303371 RepID=A0A836C9R4_9STRA|nr:WD40-repeat-containing domain protein [Tribonema minus]